MGFVEFSKVMEYTTIAQTRLIKIQFSQHALFTVMEF